MSSGYEPLLPHSCPACNVTYHTVTTAGVVLGQFQALNEIKSKKSWFQSTSCCTVQLQQYFSCAALKHYCWLVNVKSSYQSTRKGRPSTAVCSMTAS